MIVPHHAHTNPTAVIAGLDPAVHDNARLWRVR